MRLDAAADALVRCELTTLDARCADLKRKSGLEDVAESSDSEASQNGVVEEGPASPEPAEEAPAEEAPAIEEEAPAAEEDSPEAAEAKAALAARLAELEKEIETAVEAEDYERADELNTAADGLRAELDAL